MQTSSWKKKNLSAAAAAVLLLVILTAGMCPTRPAQPSSARGLALLRPTRPTPELPPLARAAADRRRGIHSRMAMDARSPQPPSPWKKKNLSAAAAVVLILVILTPRRTPLPRNFTARPRSAPETRPPSFTRAGSVPSDSIRHQRIDARPGLTSGQDGVEPRVSLDPGNHSGPRVFPRVIHPLEMDPDAETNEPLSVAPSFTPYPFLHHQGISHPDTLVPFGLCGRLQARSMLDL
ncbi:hypothetical protein HU200_018084 [Digitaria exilis]|uniref:Uncharacterized protein n=1 Tax=Digitaria exilis TaxID=1010633 RepID=A0A835KGL0_9POAL|nr:hypothetical protein HU200_018084 [Digitaria exilis]